MVEFEFPRDALCRALGLDTELFFPVGREGSPGFERSAATACAAGSAAAVAGAAGRRRAGRVISGGHPTASTEA
jgi:hypothetical protein